MLRKGVFVVIDGLDGSGKGTQTQLLVERLRQGGHSVEMADFPQYGNWSAAFVEKYLRGEFGSAHEVTAKQASLFYALDRFAAASQIRTWLQEGKVVISNRYVSANKGHQLGKLASEQEQKEFLTWLNDLEYTHLGIPVPDLTIFLHMAPEIGQKLVDQKEERNYLDGKKRDIHEADVNHLRNAEKAFLFCIQNDARENWVHIVCHRDDEPLPREQVHEKIYEKVKEKFYSSSSSF